MICQPLWVILCRLPEKGRKQKEEIVKKMKERDRGEKGKKVLKQKKLTINKDIPCYPYLQQGQQALPANITGAPGKIHDTLASPNHQHLIF